MNHLDELRVRLSVCDEQILECLLKRNAIVEDIMKYKESHNMQIIQPEQEKRQNQKLEQELEGKRHAKEILDIFHRITYNSKKIQARHLFHYNIVLIGFMGSGKSTISDYLSTMFAMDAVEMDQIISQREGMSISDIFAVYGEEYFRNLETNLLVEMQSRNNVVISCGGGTPMREKNVAEMKKNGRVVLLTASPETIYHRVKDSHDRPLLENNKNVSFITELMEKRRVKYETAADVIIETDGKNELEICEELVQRLMELDEKR
ncbi:MAG: AAA family ATPase [Lachnospiraceae bacterium]|nr:AAA family ATPase [Lachnospiraceae bacterium]MCI8872767.1 AAA family ATPase [Lachnospiraceae bacterium]MCI9058601.1 AAA family ATPase [Lachnospiraceae bacterium]GFI31515.1 shikimate kinase [Lachnospiraceae bacterium]